MNGVYVVHIDMRSSFIVLENKKKKIFVKSNNWACHSSFRSEDLSTEFLFYSMVILAVRWGDFRSMRVLLLLL